MSKYAADVNVQNDSIVIDKITLDTREDMEALIADIQRNFQLRGQFRLSARRTKAEDPATYGLAIGDSVTVGKGTTVWALDHIEYGSGENIAIVSRRESRDNTIVFHRFDVSKLIKKVVEN